MERRRQRQQLLLLLDGHNFDFVAEVARAAVNIAVHMAADIDGSHIVVHQHNLDSDLVVDNIDFDYERIHCLGSCHYDYLQKEIYFF